MPEKFSAHDVEAMLTRAPYHQWLGLHVDRVDEDGIDLHATWREDWVVSVDGRYTHGGILATLIDLTADWALVCHTGRGVPTVDLRVDYHRAAMPGDLTAKGRIIKLGRQFSVSEASIFDADGKLLASGRGVYLTTPPKG
jgi:uncharacterized protein (TIGR00369 family)